MQAVERAPVLGVLNVFLEPARALRLLADGPVRARPFVLFGLAALVAGAVLRGLAERSVPQGVDYGIVGAFRLVLAWAIFSTFFYVVGRVLHRGRGWSVAARSSAALNALTALAIVASSAIAVALALIGKDVAPTTGLIPSLALLLPPDSFASHFAYGFNVMSIWFYALVAFALVRVYLLKPATAALVTLAFVTIVNSCLALIS
jgi:hypothetical protein